MIVDGCLGRNNIHRARRSYETAHKLRRNAGRLALSWQSNHHHWWVSHSGSWQFLSWTIPLPWTSHDPGSQYIRLQTSSSEWPIVLNQISHYYWNGFCGTGHVYGRDSGSVSAKHLSNAELHSNDRFVVSAISDPLKCPCCNSLGDKSYLAANMSVFYQFPQYVGIGLSEVFTSVASLEFAYLAAPRSAQSLIMSLRFCSAGLSSFMGSGIVTLLSIEVSGVSQKNGTSDWRWLLLRFQNGPDPSRKTDNYSNDPRYYIYFFVLAGLQLVFVLIFLGCDRKYQLLKLPNLHLNPRHFQRSTSAPATAWCSFNKCDDHSCSSKFVFLSRVTAWHNIFFFSSKYRMYSSYS